MFTWLRWLEADDAKLLGAVGRHVLEGDLLAVRDRSRDSTSTMAVRAQRDRVAAERAEGAGEAVEAVLGRIRWGMWLIMLGL